MEIECKIGELDHPNNNGRIYPKDVLEKAIQNYNEKTYKFGELGCPTTQNVELQHVSHKINEVKLKDNNICANIELLDTPSGKIAHDIIKARGNLHIQPRMLINTEKAKSGTDEHMVRKLLLEMDVISFDLV